MNFNSIIDSLFAHAEETNPHECCGLVIVFKGKLKYIKCNNLLSGDTFCIDPHDYVKAEEMGEVVAVCHSHVNIPATASPPDIVSCNASKLPWIILSYPSKELNIIEPTDYVQPLIGRTFFHGVLDCYSLIRDYYYTELKIELKDYLREPDWWDKPELNLYEDNFLSEGFEIVTDGSLNLHDVILMQHGSNKVNHGAIYIGDNLILQHCTNRLSSRDVYGGYWRKNTRYVLRHKNLI